MTATVERRDYVRRRSPDQLESPVRTRKSPRRMSPPPRRGRSPVNRSPPRTRSPNKRSSSQRTRSPPKEKVPDRARSPRKAPVSSSPSRSPSPRTKRLRRAQAEKEAERVKEREPGMNTGREEREKGREKERETERRSPSGSPSPRTRRLKQSQAERQVEKTVERDSRRNAGREEREKGRDRERREAREGSGERRSVRDKNDGGHSRSRRDRSDSPGGHDHRSKRSPHSPARTSRAGARDEATRPRSAEQLRDGDVDSIAKMKSAEESLEAKDKDKAKPSFELSGKLAEETNRVKGVTLLFNEPPDARKPDIRWRLYVFKGGEVLNEPLYVHRQSCYLFGRERRVADVPTDHPSCSKQHAVLQYRLVEKEQPDGLLSKQPRICYVARAVHWVNGIESRHRFQRHHHSISLFCFHSPEVKPVELLHFIYQCQLLRPPFFTLLANQSWECLNLQICLFGIYDNSSMG